MRLRGAYVSMLAVVAIVACERFGADSSSPNDKDGGVEPNDKDGSVRPNEKDGSGEPNDAGPRTCGTAGAGVTPCSSQDAFVCFAPLDELNAAGIVDHATLTTDELTVYFQRQASSDPTKREIWTSSRRSRGDAFDPPRALPDLEGFEATYSLSEPTISPDAHLLAFAAALHLDPPSAGRLYTAARPSGSAAFETRDANADLNQQAGSFSPNFEADGRRIFLSAGVPPMLFVAAVVDGGNFHGPHLVTDMQDAGVAGLYPVSNARADEGDMSKNSVYWASADPTGVYHINEGLFADGHTLASTGPIVTPSGGTFGGGRKNEKPSWISPDECRLYFSQSSIEGNDTKLWVASRR